MCHLLPEEVESFLVLDQLAVQVGGHERISLLTSAHTVTWVYVTLHRDMQVIQVLSSRFVCSFMQMQLFGKQKIF